MSLSADDIRNCDDLTIEQVEVLEWGGSVHVRAFTGKQRDDLERQYSEDKKQPANLRAQVAARSVCDEKGKLLFSDKDIKSLGEKNAQALERIFDVAMRLSGMTPEDVEAAKKN